MANRDDDTPSPKRLVCTMHAPYMWRTEKKESYSVWCSLPSTIALLCTSSLGSLDTFVTVTDYSLFCSAALYVHTLCNKYINKTKIWSPTCRKSSMSSSFVCFAGREHWFIFKWWWIGVNRACCCLYCGSPHLLENRPRGSIDLGRAGELYVFGSGGGGSVI